MALNFVKRAKVPKKEGIKRLLRQTWLARLQEGGQELNISGSFKVSILSKFISLALKLFGKDWKKVEDYIGTRTGA